MKLEIAEARSEIMAPLSAASMESYSRAYPYLVKLHMLQVSAWITPPCFGFNITDPALEQLIMGTEALKCLLLTVTASHLLMLTI